MGVRIQRDVDVGTSVLQIAGRLQVEDVCELDKAYRNINGPVVLELSQLQSSDSAGVATLLELSSLGAEIQGASGYIELLLQRGTRPGV